MGVCFSERDSVDLPQQPLDEWLGRGGVVPRIGRRATAYQHAREKEKERDLQFNKYHNFEFGSAAFQIGIVLASAAVITSMMGLAYAAIGIGLLGMLLTAGGLFAPELLHHAMHWFETLFAGSAAHH